MKVFDPQTNFISSVSKLKTPFPEHRIISPLYIRCEDFFEIEGYLSTFNNIDLVDDVVMPGAFKDFINSVQDKKVKLPLLLAT